MAVNKYPWVKNLGGDIKPLVFPGKVQAGSTQAIKRGELCTFDETAGYWIPVDAVADRRYSLAISNEEQKAADVARYMEFIAIREDDVFEFAIDAAAAIVIGDGLELTASDSQKLTKDQDGDCVAFVCGFDNYPVSGTTITNKSTAQVVFNPVYSYWCMTVLRKNLKKVINTKANLTLKVEDCGAIVTNMGASGGVTITAPTPATAPGLPIGWNVTLACSAADAMAFDPKPDTASVIIKGAVHTAGNTVSITDEGDFISLVWDGTNWLSYASISGADDDITLT